MLTYPNKDTVTTDSHATENFTKIIPENVRDFFFLIYR